MTGTGFSPQRPTRHVRLVAAIAAGVMVVAGVLSWPRRSDVATFPQPSGVTYSDGRPHVAVLKRVRAPLAAVLPVAGHYEIVVGSDPGGDYGHHVRLDATGLDPARLTARWTPEGLWLENPTGHRLLVPTASFIGGR